jgi:hypothetical protein
MPERLGLRASVLPCSRPWASSLSEAAPCGGSAVDAILKTLRRSLLLGGLEANRLALYREVSGTADPIPERRAQTG